MSKKTLKPASPFSSLEPSVNTLSLFLSSLRPPDLKESVFTGTSSSAPSATRDRARRRPTAPPRTCLLEVKEIILSFLSSPLYLFHCKFTGVFGLKFGEETIGRSGNRQEEKIKMVCASDVRELVALKSTGSDRARRNSLASF